MEWAARLSSSWPTQLANFYCTRTTSSDWLFRRYWVDGKYTSIWTKPDHEGSDWESLRRARGGWGRILRVGGWRWRWRRGGGRGRRWRRVWRRRRKFCWSRGMATKGYSESLGGWRPFLQSWRKSSRQILWSRNWAVHEVAWCEASQAVARQIDSPLQTRYSQLWGRGLGVGRWLPFAVRVGTQARWPPQDSRVASGLRG